MAEPRTPKLVIDQAIRENRRPEWICYGIAITLVLGGLFTLIWGTVSGAAIATVVGAVATSLFYPALSAARQIREDNIAVRLLEIPLSEAKTAEDAARTLNEAFTKLFVERKAR